jgi:hypothetical protein
MRIQTVSTFYGALTLAVLAPMANLVSITPAMADVNVGPLSCVPKIPSTTTTELLYHEHYLINPPAATSNRTVVCNIPFDSATLPSTFYVGAFGLNNEGAANRTSTCWAHVVDLRNQHVPTVFRGDEFLDNPGQDMSFTRVMQTKTRVDYLWSAWSTLSLATVTAGMADPPPTPVDPAGVRSPNHWTISVSCVLKPGQALNMVSLFPTRIP